MWFLSTPPFESGLQSELCYLLAQNGMVEERGAGVC